MTVHIVVERFIDTKCQSEIIVTRFWHICHWSISHKRIWHLIRMHLERRNDKKQCPQFKCRLCEINEMMKMQYETDWLLSSTCGCLCVCVRIVQVTHNIVYHIIQKCSKSCAVAMSIIQSFYRIQHARTRRKSELIFNIVCIRFFCRCFNPGTIVQDIALLEYQSFNARGRVTPCTT